jgi:hypothetical protein
MFGHSNQNFVRISFSLIPSTFPTRLIRDLIIQIIFNEECKLCLSSVCSFLHFPVTSSLIGQNILCSLLFSDILSLCYSLMSETKFFTDRNQVKLYRCVFFYSLRSRGENRFSAWTCIARIFICLFYLINLLGISP